MMRSFMILSNVILLAFTIQQNSKFLCQATLSHNFDSILAVNEIIPEKEQNEVKPFKRVRRNLQDTVKSIETLPATTNHTATLLFLHDVGETGNYWTFYLKYITQPHMDIVCPTAADREVTIYNYTKITAWWDKREFDRYEREDVEGIKEAVKAIQYMIAMEINHGINPERIIVGGFQQGGALALQAALTFPVRLGGIVVWSTWLPMIDKFEKSMVTANKDIPILQCSGNPHKYIALRHAERTAEVLKTVSKNFQYKMYKDMKHSTCDEAFRDIQNFLIKYIGPD